MSQGTVTQDSILEGPGDGSLTSVSDSRRFHDRYQSYILPLAWRPVIRTNRSYSRWRDFQRCPRRATQRDMPVRTSPL